MEAIGNCCDDAFTGKSPKYSKTKTEYKIIGQQSNQRYGLDFRYVKYGTTEFGLTQDKRFFLKYNDVLLNTLGTGSIGRSGIYKLNEPILTDGHLFVFRTSKNCLPNYLFYFLRFNEKEIIDSASGSTNQKFLKLKSFLDFEIPVPPLSEQERIVARIEELFSQLDAGVETLKKLKAQLAIYRQAVLKEAFEGIETFIPLEKIAIRVFDGPFGTNLKTADYTDSGVRVVRLENLKNAWFDDTKKSFVTFEKYESIKAHTVFPFDLIMSTFISDSIKICQLPPYIGYAVNKADCVGIRLKAEIIPHFIMYYMSSRRAYNDLVNQVHGATRPRVNTRQIKALNVPIVEVKKQEIIVSKIESSLSVCDNIEQTVDASLQQADALRQSILKDAFEGRL